MIKRMTLIKRKPGISREEFIKHYEQVHAVLVLKYFPVVHYRRNYIVVPEGAPEAEFDVITETWYKDMESIESSSDAMGGLFARDVVGAGFQSDLGKIIRSDGAAFTNGQARRFLVDERISR